MTSGLIAGSLHKEEAKVKFPFFVPDMLILRSKKFSFVIVLTHHRLDRLSYLQSAVVVSIEGSTGSDTSCFQFTHMIPQRKWMKLNRKCYGGKRTLRWVASICHQIKIQYAVQRGNSKQLKNRWIFIITIIAIIDNCMEVSVMILYYFKSTIFLEGYEGASAKDEIR